MDVLFKNSINLNLAGRLELPQKKNGKYPIVIFAHGFDSGKDSPRGVVVASALRERGIATFLFDFTGHGQSQGSKWDSTIVRQVDDLKCAVNYILKVPEVDKDRIGINGASSGGLVALKEVLEDRNIKVLVLRGPRVDGMEKKAAFLSIPILIIQGEIDPLLADSKSFCLGASNKISLNIVPGADHLFSRPSDLSIVVKLTVSWYEKKL